MITGFQIGENSSVIADGRAAYLNSELGIQWFCWSAPKQVLGRKKQADNGHECT